MIDMFMIILVTFLPFLELRASIPYGILQTNVPVLGVFIIAVTANILLAVFLYFFLDSVVHLLTRVPVIGNAYQHIIVRSQRKVHRYVEKYGVLGLALFIGIPLPGSGVYTGTLAAYTLGFGFREFFRAVMIGVFIAGSAVTLLTLSGSGLTHIVLMS
jgi:uncharacterized membrane protein